LETEENTWKIEKCMMGSDSETMNTSESIVAKRLVRNLRYKLTYVKIFESYGDSAPGSGPEVAQLLESLIEAQQAAISSLSSYLRSMDVSSQGLELNEKLMNQALERDKLQSRLRFIHDGLSRAASWYKTQLMDKQMTADPKLQQLLLELGEIEAAKLWRTEAVMASLKVAVALEEKDWDSPPQPEQVDEEVWRPRLVEDVGRPAWGGSQQTRWPRPPRRNSKG
jgi:hypothetical protein